MFISRRKLVIISVLIIVVFTFSLCFSSMANYNLVDYDNVVKVVLDAGHGGIDSGVSGVSTSVKESELNLIYAKKIEKNLQNAGMSVVLTRNSNAGLYGVATKNRKRKDMEKRREIINESQPNLIVSIHMNKYSISTRRGAQVFYKKNDESSKLLAQSIQNELNGMEESSRNCSILTGDYYILNCSNFPAVIVECGFLSNIEDEKLLIDTNYQEKLSYTIFRGIVSYLSKATIKFN